jgi:hypothetical protein
MRYIRLLLVPLALILLYAAPSSGAAGGSATLVVSQVFAAGGNSGATYANDYVELFNRGTAAVDLSGWSVQYASAASTSWAPTALSGTLAAGRAYLVQLASGGTAGAALPTPDATGTTNLATTGGKVAVVHDTASLTCGASAGSCSGVSTIADLVGYGSAADYEGTGAAPAPGATTAVTRAGGGCTDTDSNAADLAAAAPAPRTTATAASACSGTTTGTSTAASSGVQVQIQPLVSVSLDQATVDFGNLAAGATPASLGENVTVASNDAAGYSLTAHRSAFAPRDLPLGLTASAPAGGQLAAGLSPTTPAALPIAPAADLLVGSSTAVSAVAGDVWATGLGFTSALPAVAAGRYTATVTYTVIAR